MQVQAPHKVAPAPDAPAAVPSALRAVVLLAGTPRASALLTGVQRSPVDLPLDENRTLLEHWIEHCRELARHRPHAPLQLRVLVNANSPAPQPRPHEPEHGLEITIEREPAAFRGSGGAVRDAAAAYGDEDRILVASAGQILATPMVRLFAALHGLGADAAVLAHGDGTPGGLSYLRCGTLRDIPERGFVDLKEQALPRLARRYDVRVLEDAGGSVLPVRTSSDYLAALRWYHRRGQGDGEGAAQPDTPFAEDWQRTFAIVEPGSTVDPGAWIHDSVVLAGARVEDGATVVRSIVGPGGRVGRRGRAIDEIVAGETTNGRHRD